MLFTSMFFEFVLSPLGNPITGEGTVLDWDSLVATLKYLGFAWFVGGVLLLLVIRALEKRGSGSDLPSNEGIARKEGSSEVDE